MGRRLYLLASRIHIFYIFIFILHLNILHVCFILVYFKCYSYILGFFLCLYM
jgi:hypothetical protein